MYVVKQMKESELIILLATSTTTLSPSMAISLLDGNPSTPASRHLDRLWEPGLQRTHSPVCFRR